MANLSNCTITQYGPILESPGDSIENNTLETQSLPDDTLLNIAYFSQEEAGVSGMYFLEISSNPGYHVHSGLITINDIAAPAGEIETDSSGFNATGDPIEYPNGIRRFTGGEVNSYNLSSEIDEVVIWDSNGNEWWKCDNKVMVQVIINPGFVMPESDLSLKIDFDGDGIPCDEVDPYFTPIPLEDRQLTWEMYTGIIITNEFISDGAPPTKVVFAAKYYDTDYVENQFDNHYIDHGPWTAGGEGMAAEYNLNPFDIELDCINETQPTCFQELGDNLNNINQFTTNQPSGALSTIANDQGKIAIPYHEDVLSDDLWQMTINNPDYTDSFNLSLTTSVINSSAPLHSHYKIYQNAPWSQIYPINVEAPELSLETNPVIYPGDGQIPSSESWEIEISGSEWGEGYELVAQPEFVDVWGGVTVITYQNGYVASSVGESPMCPQTFNFITGTGMSADNNFDTDDVTYALWTAANNECDMDLSNVTLTQVTPTRVRINIPYRSDLAWIRGTEENSSSISDQRFNKIFVNIHPIQI